MGVVTPQGFQANGLANGPRMLMDLPEQEMKTSALFLTSTAQATRSTSFWRRRGIASWIPALA